MSDRSHVNPCPGSGPGSAECARRELACCNAPEVSTRLLSENRSRYRRVVDGVVQSRGSIRAMPRPPRTRPIGRPALPYRPVQMNTRVHPEVKKQLAAVAEKRGVTLGALLLELAAEVSGMSVDSLLASSADGVADTELPMTG